MSLYGAIWPFIRSLDPEDAHRLTLRALTMGAGRLWLPPREAPELAIDVLGLRFPNPVGIAAGFDKDGIAASALLNLGFGFIELGTVTPRPQAGNPKPRLFRLEVEKAVINRMGFNNRGAEALAARLARRRPGGIIGINIGANKDSIDRIADYEKAYITVAPYADYIAVNVSSPNTVGLRGLQERNELRELITRLQVARERGARALPLLVKIAPDLDAKGVLDVVEIAAETGLDGLIISNTTIDRAGLHGPHAEEQGGLSGVPLFQRSTAMLADVFRMTKGALPLIGVGGIASPRDAYDKILAGASLVQLYTGLVYQGPGLIGRIRAGLVGFLRSDGYARLSDAIGASAGAGAAPLQSVARSA